MRRGSAPSADIEFFSDDPLPSACRSSPFGSREAAAAFGDLVAARFPEAAVAAGGAKPEPPERLPTTGAMAHFLAAHMLVEAELSVGRCVIWGLSPPARADEAFELLAAFCDAKNVSALARIPGSAEGAAYRAFAPAADAAAALIRDAKASDERAHARRALFNRQHAEVYAAATLSLAEGVRAAMAEASVARRTLQLKILGGLIRVYAVLAWVVVVVNEERRPQEPELRKGWRKKRAANPAQPPKSPACQALAVELATALTEAAKICVCLELSADRLDGNRHAEFFAVLGLSASALRDGAEGPRDPAAARRGILAAVGAALDVVR